MAQIHPGEYHVDKPQEYPEPLSPELQKTAARLNPPQLVRF